MKRAFKLGDKEVEMVATAATPILYSEYFHEDAFKEITADEVSPSVVQKMAFVMAKEAEHGGKAFQAFTSMKKEDFITWLMDFGPADFWNAGADIMELFSGTGGMSRPKRKGV